MLPPIPSVYMDSANQLAIYASISSTLFSGEAGDGVKKVGGFRMISYWLSL